MRSRLSPIITDSLLRVRMIMYAEQMSSAKQIVPDVARAQSGIFGVINSEGEIASSSNINAKMTSATNRNISHVKLRMLNGLYARAICLLVICLKTTSLVNVLMTPSSSPYSVCAFSRSKVFWKLSSPRIERFITTVMALISTAKIGLIMRMASFMYSPGVCDVITIDLRYRGPLCMSHCVQCITRNKSVLPRKQAILRMRGFVVSMVIVCLGWSC